MNDGEPSPDRYEQRLRWSPWSRCESSFSLVLVPSLPGVFVVAEEVIAPGETPVLGERRMLAVLKVAAAATASIAGMPPATDDLKPSRDDAKGLEDEVKELERAEGKGSEPIAAPPLPYGF